MQTTGREREGGMCEGEGGGQGSEGAKERKKVVYSQCNLK